MFLQKLEIKRRATQKEKGGMITLQLYELHTSKAYALG